MKKKKKCGDTEVRSRDFSHAKRTLYRWAISPTISLWKIMIITVRNKNIIIIPCAYKYKRVIQERVGYDLGTQLTDYSHEYKKLGCLGNKCMKTLFCHCRGTPRLSVCPLAYDTPRDSECLWSCMLSKRLVFGCWRSEYLTCLNDGNITAKSRISGFKFVVQGYVIHHITFDVKRRRSRESTMLSRSRSRSTPRMLHRIHLSLDADCNTKTAA